MVKISSNLTGVINGKFAHDEIPAIAVRGKSGRSSGCGLYIAGNARCGENNQFGGIYQKRVTGYNNTGRKEHLPRKTYYVRMRSYAPTNPRTEIQQANRMKFAACGAAWKLLTDEQKAYYNAKVKRAGQLGYHFFVKEYMSTH